MHKSLISIIITSKNEADVISDLINSINRQTFKNIETILIDNNSSDWTVEVAKKAKVKVYTFGPERSAQRNYGFSKSKGDYVFFLDADMRLESTVAEECLRKIPDKNIGAIIIPEESFGEGFLNKIKAFERSFYNESGDNATDAARFFDRKVFIKAGGYDESITGPEDWDLPETIKKMGYKIGRIKSKIYHKERISSIFVLARKKFYYGLKTQHYLKKQDISIFSPKTIYFLRPVFYKQWKKLLLHPILSMGMCIMLSIELICGGTGYLVGKFKKI